MDNKISNTIIDKLKNQMGLSAGKDTDILKIKNITSKQLHRPIIDEIGKIINLLSIIAKESNLNPSDFSCSYNKGADEIIINYKNNR